MNDVCGCGHALETHFLDQEDRPKDSPDGPRQFRGTCLAMRCECRRYKKAEEPR